MAALIITQCFVSFKLQLLRFGEKKAITQRQRWWMSQKQEECEKEDSCNVLNRLKKRIISIVKSTRFTNVSNVFWNDTLLISDGLSIHHQEFKTVHRATDICQTDTVVCLQAGRSISLTNACCCMYSLELLMMASRQQYLFDKCLLL